MVYFLLPYLDASFQSVIVGIPNGFEAPAPKKNEISFVETDIMYTNKITIFKAYDPDQAAFNAKTIFLVEYPYIISSLDRHLFIILIILSCSSFLSRNCLSLSLSLLLVGDIRNTIPQQVQNTLS